jgi:hypothetical protein
LTRDETVFIPRTLTWIGAYFTLNLLEKYEQRTLVAVLVVIYASMRIVLALRSLADRSDVLHKDRDGMILQRAN